MRLRSRLVVLALVCTGCAASRLARPRSVVSSVPDESFDAPMFVPARGTVLAAPESLREGPSSDGVPWPWEVLDREEHVLAGATVKLVRLSHPGEGAALVLLREEPGGDRVIAAYSVVHGGSGAELTVARRSVRPDGALELHLRIVRHSRGYWLPPGRGTCPAQEPHADSNEERLQNELDRCRVGPESARSESVLAVLPDRAWVLQAETPLR